MSNIGGSSGDVVIKLRLDTSQAEADLKRFQSGIGAATVVTGRMTGGGVPGGGYGPGGGLGIGRMLGMAGGLGLGAAFGGGDLAAGVGGLAAGFGSVFSESRGFAAFRRGVAVPGQAARNTVDQLGIAGQYASEQQIRAMFEFNQNLGNMGADAEKRVRGVLGKDIAKSYEEQVGELVKLILANWPIILAGFVAMRAGGGLTGAAIGIGAGLAADAIQSGLR